MRYNDDRTKVIGGREFREESMDEYKQFNNAYGDEDTSSDFSNEQYSQDAYGQNDADRDELAFMDEEFQKDSQTHQADFNAGYEAGLASASQRYSGQNEDEDGDDYDDKSSRKRKKKKSHKVLIIAIIAILVLGGAGGAYAYMTLNGTEDLEVNLEDTMSKPDVSGYDGEGTLSELSIDQDSVDKIVSGLKNDDQKSAVSDFFDKVTYEADKTKKLSNGDKITIKGKYDSALASKAHITVAEKNTSFTVSDLKEKKAEETSVEMPIDLPQWYRFVNEDSDEISITALLIAKKGTSVTLPIEFMYCTEGGAMSEMVDTSGDPNLTYNGKGYYIEDGYEAPTGTIVEVDEDHIKYSLKQYGSSYTLTVKYTISDNDTLNVESATGGEVQVPTGKYSAISSDAAKQLMQ